MEKPLVSIIIPVYNAKNHIVGCLESIRRQTYENIEMILLNDGSKDVSLPLLKMYADVDKRIVLVDKKNSGVSTTRNLGLSLARGKYLQFVDSDDTLEPDATRKMVEKAEKYGADMVIAHYNRVEPQPEKQPGKLTEAAVVLGLAEQKKEEPKPDKVTPFGFLPEGALTKQEFAVGLMHEPASFYYGVMWNKLYRADIIREHQIQCSQELSWSEDFLFNLCFVRYAERFYSLAVPIYNYVQNPTSICHTQIHPVSIVKTKLELFEYYRKLYEEMGLYEDNKPQIYKYLVATAEGVVPTRVEIRGELKEKADELVEKADELKEKWLGSLE